MNTETKKLAMSCAYPVLERGGNGLELTNSGMPLLAYFMVHAPKEVPQWFEPAMRKKPAFGVEPLSNAHAFGSDQAKALHKRNQAKIAEQAEWEKEWLEKKCLQWPMAWAKAQIDLLAQEMQS